jgi:hypothetical protein
MADAILDSLAALPGDKTHGPFDGVGVLAQTFGFKILVKKAQGFFAGRNLFSHDENPPGV